MSGEPAPDHVFLPRFAPKEGETTIVEISPALFELLRSQLPAYREVSTAPTRGGDSVARITSSRA